VIRLAPPLIIKEAVADALVRALPGVLDAARGA
jgi:acetylornithine aminotransferase